MNRHARRAAGALRQPVEAYRVPHGRVALTFDLHGRAPSTIAIRSAALADLVDRVDKLVAGRTYQQVLHLLVAAIEAGDAGDAEAWNAALVGYWLACNHPQAGAEMTARLADAIALDGRAHLTLHGNRDRGIAWALGDSFADLDDVADIARQAGVTETVIVAAAPRRTRPGGQA